MQTINATIPATITVEIKYHGTQTLALDNMSADWFEWAIRNGVKQSVGDAAAGKANTEDGRKAVLDKYNRIAEGKVPAQGAGGGAKANPETIAERQVVADVLHNSFGFGKTEAKKEAKAGWVRLFEAYVRDEAKEAGEEITDETIAELATEDNLKAVADMHAEAYKTALKVAKGGTKAVKTTGFLKK